MEYDVDCKSYILKIFKQKGVYFLISFDNWV